MIKTGLYVTVLNVWHLSVQVYPLSGPIGGGTLVNISGKDLGSKFEEVQNAVSIAGVRCAPLRDKYQASQWILCKLGSVPKPRSGIVTVALPNRPAVNFHQKFHYRVGNSKINVFEIKLLTIYCNALLVS